MKGHNNFDKELPTGHYIYFHDLSLDTTEEDIQTVILNRTGVLLPLERIAISHPPERFNCLGAVISLERQFISELLAWTLSEDEINGQRVKIAMPKVKQ